MRYTWHSFCNYIVRSISTTEFKEEVQRRWRFILCIVIKFSLCWVQVFSWNFFFLLRSLMLEKKPVGVPGGPYTEVRTCRRRWRCRFGNGGRRSQCLYCWNGPWHELRGLITLPLEIQRASTSGLVALSPSFCVGANRERPRHAGASSCCR
jgi:hypothetical protein